MRRVVVAVVPPVLFTAPLVGLWWAATTWWGVRPFIAPSPPRVAAVFVERTDYLVRSTGTTAAEAGLGFAVAAAAGVVTGALLASWPALARATLPTLVGLDAVPKLALAPPLVLWLGFGTAPKVVIVVATCLLPIVLSTIGGLTSTPADAVELARCHRATWWQELVKVRFPFALPRIFVGLRIAAPLSVIGAVIGEFFGAIGGLGYAIRAAGADTALVWAALLLLAAMSLTVFSTVSGLERLLVPWARHVKV